MAKTSGEGQRPEAIIDGDNLDAAGPGRIADPGAARATDMTGLRAARDEDGVATRSGVDAGTAATTALITSDEFGRSVAAWDDGPVVAREGDAFVTADEAARDVAPAAELATQPAEGGEVWHPESSGVDV